MQRVSDDMGRGPSRSSTDRNELDRNELDHARPKGRAIDRFLTVAVAAHAVLCSDALQVCEAMLTSVARDRTD